MITKEWVRNNNLGYTSNARNHRVSKAAFTIRKLKNRFEDNKQSIKRVVSKIKPKKKEIVYG